MKKNFYRNIASLVLVISGCCLSTSTLAQVTIGSSYESTVGALLDIKSQQAKSTTDPLSTDNITSTTGGLLLPRVKLEDPTSLIPFIALADQTKEVKASLTGLMVYNLSVITNTFEAGIYVWDGEMWLTGGFTRIAQHMSIAGQPKSFTFYETGEENAAEVVDLVFTVNPIIDIAGEMIEPTYQWFQLTGNNIHVPLREKIVDATSKVFNPYTTVIKGTTRNANNADLFKFVCVATSQGSVLESDVAEIAVGCGAKTVSGEWLSFMCFNLGADNNSTIGSQMTYKAFGGFTNATGGVHTYIENEGLYFGDLFQWGRIPDGHQKANSDLVQYDVIQQYIVNGKTCNSTDTSRPFSQIDKNESTAYGKYITVSTAPNENWNQTTAASITALWSNAITQNDPCSHYNSSTGGFSSFWLEVANNTTDPACAATGVAGWKLPSQAEFGEIYRGGFLSGTYGAASANQWLYYNYKDIAGGVQGIRGAVVKPDNETITLYFPINGIRNATGGLRYQGNNGYYWTETASANQAYVLRLLTSEVNPAHVLPRGDGLGIRCIKKK